MNCTKIKRWLPDYSVGGLSRRKRKLVANHVAHCSHCKRQLTALNKTASLLDSIQLEDPPDFLWESVRVRILHQEQPVKVSPWKESIQWLWGKHRFALAVGMVLLMLIVGGYFTLRKIPTDTEVALDTTIKQYAFSQWNDPFADRAALGLLAIQTGLEGENHEILQ